ncbi:hypothetical protein GRI72_06545 [Altererythrobacter marinus]|uniref:KAP NTPase domain-containing protein n=1 Tax=Pelagerythrobacter marinus TaxID=538382 RepID=A0ABW9V0K4_9SPHN|nr:hypothetical protein [Pelagerythrobacter marinus]
MSGQSDDKNRAVRRTILQDSPTETDQFSGRGHARTAYALARAISQFRSGDHAVGIEGSWGSGKSSIVRMAKTALAEVDAGRTYHIFTFDLWANQTGHFRRAFLEALLSWGSKEFPDKGSAIDEWRRKIESKNQKIETNNYKKFSKFGLFTVIFLYLTPLLYLWLAPTALRDSTGAVKFNAGAAAAGILLGIYVVSFLIAVWRRLPSERTSARWVEAFSQVISIFSRDAEVRRVNQTIRDEDPTQYEFTKIFREISARLQDNQNRLIVVFDNIDRLPSKRIPDVWSEVRGVFYGEHFGAETDGSIIAIVPYAERIALSAMGGECASPPPSESSIIAGDVFRKSFDIVFNVSPPVLSDASTFFREKFIASVGDQISLDSIKRIYRIFNLNIESSNAPPTPRQVISFINDVASYWEQWEGAIAPESVAVFVANKTKLLSDPGSLRSSDTIDPRMVQLANQPDIFRDLASLAYNVDRDLAFQVLSHVQIQRALTVDQPDLLQELADSASVNGFAENLNRLVDELSQDWGSENLTELSAAISNIAAVNIDRTDLEYSQKTLATTLQAVKAFPFAQMPSLSGLWKASAFIEEATLPSFVGAMVRAINAGLPAEPAKQTLQHGRSWIKIVAAICDAVKSAKGTDAVSKVLPTIVLPSGSAAVLGAALDCDETDYHIRQFKRPANEKDIVAALDQYATGSDFFSYMWAELSHLFDVEQCVHLLEVALENAKAKKLDISTDEFRALIKTVDVLQSAVPIGNEPATTALQDFFQSGAPMYYAYHADKDGGKIRGHATALFFWLAMREYKHEQPGMPQPQQAPIFGNMLTEYNWFRAKLTTSELEPDFVNSIAEIANRTAAFEYVLKHACSEEDGRELFKSVARAMLARNEATLPDATFVISNFLKLRKALGEQFQTLLSLVGTSSVAAYWQSAELGRVSLSMLREVEGRTEIGWESFTTSIAEMLKSVGSARWQKELDEDGALVKLLCERNTVKPVKLTSTEFFEPLMSNALKVMTGAYDPKKSERNYGILLKSLPPSSQRRFESEFFDRHNSHTSAVSAALEHLRSILDRLPYRTNPNRTVERYLLPLARENSSEAKAFIEAKKDIFKDCMQAADRDLVGQLREFVEGLEGDTDEGQVSIRKLLGFPVNKTEAEQPE